ncbi:hypothetical protein [Brevundimonas vesicularis]|uniref:hypothetical protein n=1 Tax=Brevundimonas vesicularis TaxID=41276 RepID=UPI0038D441E3
MIAILAALVVQTAPLEGSADPADWACAEPLVQRNYSRTIDARDLALRIADECVRSFEYRHRALAGEAEVAASIMESQARTLYSYRQSIFVSQIEGRILQARRRDAIPLN